MVKQLPDPHLKNYHMLKYLTPLRDELLLDRYLEMLMTEQVVEVGLHQETGLVCNMKWDGRLDFRWVGAS